VSNSNFFSTKSPQFQT